METKKHRGKPRGSVIRGHLSTVIVDRYWRKAQDPCCTPNTLSYLSYMDGCNRWLRKNQPESLIHNFFVQILWTAQEPYIYSNKYHVNSQLNNCCLYVTKPRHSKALLIAGFSNKHKTETLSISLKVTTNITIQSQIKLSVLIQMLARDEID